MKRILSAGSLSIAIALALLVLVTTSTPVPANAATGGYDLSWNVIAGGGGMNLTGGPYSLGATIGQFDTGGSSQSGYSLSGGFWADLFGTRVLLPSIFRP